MADLQRGQGNRIWITRTHLAALGVGTFFVAILAFFVGVRVGSSRVEPATAQSTVPLVPSADQDDALEALLREVEHARAAVDADGNLVTGEARDLTFPEALTGGQPAEPPPLETDDLEASGGAAIPDPDRVPTAPDPTDKVPPQRGWSVQIAAYEDPSEADARMAQLEADGHEAYRVDALIDGRTWYRVRIGGYASRKQAEAARVDLVAQLGEAELMIAEAP